MVKEPRSSGFTALYRARLEEIDQILSVLCAEESEPPVSFYGPAELLHAAFEAQWRGVEQALVREAVKAFGQGDKESTLSLLDVLADFVPNTQHFRLDEQVTMRQELSEFLAHIAGDWPWRREFWALRAVLGMRCFLAGRKADARRLLDGIPWETLNRPMHYLSSHSLLAWGGFADIAEDMVRGFMRNRHWSLEDCRRRSPAFGIACATSGMRNEASGSLLPLLSRFSGQPQELMSILGSFIGTGGEREASKFLQRSGILPRLKEELDPPQLAQLGQYLYNLGMEGEAGGCFAEVATRAYAMTLTDLPKAVYGLCFTGNWELASRLIDDTAARMIEGIGQDGEMQSCFLAESLLIAGRLDEARERLLGIARHRAFGDPLSPALFRLYERLSMPQGMRELLPSICATDDPVAPETLEYYFAFSLYDGSLRPAAETTLRSRNAYKDNPGYLKILPLFHFWLGEFRSIGECLESPVFSGGGLPGLHRLYWLRKLRLSEGRLDEALEASNALLELLDAHAICLGNAHSWASQYIEHILLLRHLGLAGQALAAARRGLARHGAFNNPCGPLVTTLEREAAGVPADHSEAKLYETAADILCGPRDYCQVLLYLKAAAIREELGQADEVRRLLATKVAHTIIAPPAVRRRLAGESGRPLTDIRDILHRCAFPHFTGTFWNDALDEFLFTWRRNRRGGEV